MIQIILQSYLPRPSQQAATRATSPTSWPLPRKLIKLDLIQNSQFDESPSETALTPTIRATMKSHPPLRIPPMAATNPTTPASPRTTAWQPYPR